MRSGDFRTSYEADMAVFDTALARWLLAGFVAALLLFPLIGTSFWLDVSSRVGIAVIAALGLNILTGFTGQISLGNAAFLAVGAYTTAWLAGKGVPFIIAMYVSGLVSALVGMVFGIPSIRLRPRTSIERGSSRGNAEPSEILIASDVRSPIKRLYFRLMY